MKKFLVFLVIVVVMGIATLPLWSKKLADEAFLKPEDSSSPEKVLKAIQFQMCIYIYPEAKKFAEKAIIYFPESKEMPEFVYKAALCSEKSNNTPAAIYWYGYFIDRYPKHEWFNQAQNNYNKLKALNSN